MPGSLDADRMWRLLCAAAAFAPHADGRPFIQPQPSMVFVSGSSRLARQVEQVALREELRGCIALAPRFTGATQPSATAQELHRRKIDRADELVVVYDGNIGQHVADEIAYAENRGISVRYVCVGRSDDIG